MKIPFLVPAILLPILASAQTSDPDSTQKLKEVVVRAYFTEQPVLRSAASVTGLGRS